MSTVNLPALPQQLPKSQGEWQALLNVFQVWQKSLKDSQQTGVSAMAGTTQSVTFAYPMPVGYRVAFSGDGTGGPFWATNKTANGFTINAASSFTGNVDWIAAF